MNSKSFWATTAVFFLLSAVGPRSYGTLAQLTDMATCLSGFSWNQNSLLQDPCEVSSLLDAACRGVGSYSIPALNSTENYVPPQGDNQYDLDCDCNTVMYSLYMACSTCQGGVIYSWTKWIAQCESVYVTQYPKDIPYGTAIPHWAYYNVTTLPNETYDDSVAISVGDSPEATPKPLSTATYKTSTSSHFSSDPTSTSNSNSNSNSDSGSSSGKKLPLAAIIGGAAGGVALIAAIILIIFLVKRRNRKSSPPSSMQPVLGQETSEYHTVQPMSPMSPNLPYDPTTSPGPGPHFNPPTSPAPHYNNGMPGQYNAMPGQGPPYGGMPAQNPPYAGMPVQNPPPGAGLYNPDDPTTFPSAMGDGQSSAAYTTQGPGRYGGMPEL